VVRHLELLVLALVVGCASSSGLVQPRVVHADRDVSVELALGESVRLVAPGGGTWQVTGGEPLLGVESEPGTSPSSWTVTGRARGEGELALEALVDAGCADPPNCPPIAAPPRVTMPFRVR
jgi:hypothetical protein